MLYSLNDVCIIPAPISDISSRSECNPYNEINMLPLFTAPMSCVIDENNWETFKEEKINIVIPRNVDINIRLNLSKKIFVAVSLEEFEKYFINMNIVNHPTYVCIDIANGHMKKLLDLCLEAKTKFNSSLIIMTGNIANPLTYIEYAKVGIDYVRIGIGSGNVCTTSANGGIHYPMGDLIKECVINKRVVEQYIDPNGQSYKYNQKFSYYKSCPKIIADGGFKNFDQIIKALALGADYCMLGEIFAKTEEACGEILYKEEVTSKHLHLNELEITKNKHFYREYYGMSTKQAQKEFGKKELKTSEGISKEVTIDYTLSQWIENFIHYLKSTMSYTNSRNLEEFKKCKTNLMTQQSFNAYYK